MSEKENYRYKDREEYLDVLNSVLPEKFIKTRDLGSGRISKYVPVPIQESMADILFREWNVIDESYTVIINELLCTVKLTFTPDYPGAEEQFCTGSAATAIQMMAQSKVTDFPAKKITNALEYNTPSVRKKAISDALETLGNIFGRNAYRSVGKEGNGKQIILESDFSFREKKKDDLQTIK